MKTKQNILILMLGIGISLYGCSSGTTSSAPTTSAPVGPVSYDYINRVFQNKTTTNNLQSSRLQSGSGCGSIMGDAGFASGLLSFVPVVGPAFGALGIVTAFAGTLGNSSCVQNQFNAINNQLNAQQTQIESLIVGVSLLNSEFAQAQYATATAIAALNSQNWNNAIEYVSGNAGGDFGLIGNFMIDVTAWNSDASVNQNATIQNIATQYNMSQASQNLDSQQTKFQYSIQNISGSQYSPSSCGTNSSCYNTVTEATGTALIATYASLYNSLIAMNNESATSWQNFIPNYDQYNNTIAAIYQKSLYALQQAFSIEYIINQMNYSYSLSLYSNNTGPQSEITQIDSLGNVPGTSFNYNDEFNTGSNPPTESQLTMAYNNAQQQLSLMYAARMNQLYINTLNYTVSDVPVGNESYPASINVTYSLNNSQTVTLPQSISYATQVNTVGSTPVAYANTFGYTLPAGSMLYQYSGLNNATQCSNNRESYNLTSTELVLSNALNSSNCPSIFESSGGGAYNQSVYIKGINAQPYFTESSGSAPTLVGYTFKNLGLCNPGNYLAYTSYNNTNYLVCTSPNPALFSPYMLSDGETISTNIVNGYVSPVMPKGTNYVVFDNTTGAQMQPLAGYSMIISYWQDGAPWTNTGFSVSNGNPFTFSIGQVGWKDYNYTNYLYMLPDGTWTLNVISVYGEGAGDGGDRQNYFMGDGYLANNSAPESVVFGYSYNNWPSLGITTASNNTFCVNSSVNGNVITYSPASICPN